jgi:hypothetical protein
MQASQTGIEFKDSVYPSGSLNQDTLCPSGLLYTPNPVVAEHLPDLSAGLDMRFLYFIGIFTPTLRAKSMASG